MTYQRFETEAVAAACVWVRLNIIRAQPTVAWLIRGPVDGPCMTANYTAARSAPSHPAHFHRAS